MPAHITHNTYTVIDVDDELCKMFRCDRWWFIDRSMLDLVANDDMRGLVKFRLKHIRDGDELSTQDLPLMRHDGTIFIAKVLTQQIGDKLFDTQVEYLYEC